MKTLKERFDDKWTPEPNSGRWLWTGAVNPQGYGKMTMGRNGNKITKGAHRISFELMKGVIPEGMDICHKCDTPACVNSDHLFAGTRKDNLQDAIKKGLFYRAKGENHGNSIFKELEIKEIRKSNLTQSQLAKQYHCSKSAIKHIKRNRVWKHVGE